MNEVSGGKQELASTSSWETLPSQQLPSISTIHHHHQPLPQDTNPSVTQVIVPTPVKLQPPILSPPPNVEHCTVLTHVQQPALMTQVNFQKTDFDNRIFKSFLRDLIFINFIFFRRILFFCIHITIIIS